MALTKVSGPLLHGSNDNLGNYNINNITGAAATLLVMFQLVVH